MKSIKESLYDALNETRDVFLRRSASAFDAIRDFDKVMYRPGEGWKLDDIFDKKDGIRKVRTILSVQGFSSPNKDFIRAWDEIQKIAAKDEFSKSTMRQGVGGPIEYIGKTEAKYNFDALFDIITSYADGQPKYKEDEMMDGSTTWIPAQQGISSFKGLSNEAREYVPSDNVLKKSSYFKMHVGPSGISYTCVPKDLSAELEDVVFKTYEKLTNLADPRK